MTSERSARELAAPIRDHLIDVHIELGTATRHPDMQRKHIVMLPGENFIAGLNDQLVALIIKPLPVVVCDRGSFLQRSVGGDHFAGNQVFPDTKVLKRPLGLRAPEFVCGNVNDAEAVRLFPHFRHGYSPSFYNYILDRFSVPSPLRQPSMLRGRRTCRGAAIHRFGYDVKM